jgi:hypothetical protein
MEQRQINSALPLKFAKIKYCYNKYLITHVKRTHKITMHCRRESDLV